MNYSLRILAVVFLLTGALRSGAATLTLFAGGGAKATGLATDCRLADPFAVDFDAQGNTYICEMTNNRIVKVDARGQLTVFAGTTKKGGAGDGGAAADAELNGPHHLIVAKNGDVLIADTWNWKIRRVDAKTGAFLWRYDKALSIYKATIPSPVAKGDVVYTGGAGKGGGAVQIKKGDDGKIVAEQIYFSPKLPTAIGGSVLVGDLLFGTTGKAMLCSDFKTGELKWEDNALGAASLCFADGRLYLHGENGDVALVEPTAEGYREKGRFTPPAQPKRFSQMEKAWAYPVVANGRLYLRDQAVLWCYDVKSEK